MGIINYYRKWIKSEKLPDVSKMGLEELKEHMRLIVEKKSSLPAMMRKAVVEEAKRRGI